MRYQKPVWPLDAMVSTPQGIIFLMNNVYLSCISEHFGDNVKQNDRLLQFIFYAFTTRVKLP
jgi:hypothetical protein